MSTNAIAESLNAGRGHVETGAAATVAGLAGSSGAPDAVTMSPPDADAGSGATTAEARRSLSGVTNVPPAEPVPVSDVVDADDHADGDTADTADADAEADDGLDADDDQRRDGDALTRARQQAARYRTRLRETEAERDDLRSQLDAQRRAVVDWMATNRTRSWEPTVARELLDAAGLDVSQLLSEDDGHLDMAKANAFIEETANRFKVTRGFAPNPAQGAGGTGHVAPSIADAFRR